MTNTLILLLLVVLTAASFYAIWLQRQRSVAPDSSGEAERISELELAQREAELEVARLQERLKIWKVKKHSSARNSSWSPTRPYKPRQKLCKSR